MSAMTYDLKIVRVGDSDEITLGVSEALVQKLRDASLRLGQHRQEKTTVTVTQHGVKEAENEFYRVPAAVISEVVAAHDAAKKA